MKSQTFNSPAKINLRLDILGKRPDGFHELRMIMVPITLYDVIHFEITHSKKIECDSNRKDLCGENNLMYKAVLLLQSKYKVLGNTGFKIFLEKNIPVGAGLGGGSGNAATTILALNQLFNLNLTENTMAELAAELGSDVPFFIYQKPAMVRGRGEKVTLLENFPQFYCNLIYPNIAISTKKMYDAFDLELTKKPHDDKNLRLFTQIKELEFTEYLKFFHNDFDNLCTSLYPEVAKVKDLLMKSHASHAMVSGSGSSVFGIYKTKEEQNKAYTWLQKNCKNNNYFIRSIETLGFGV